MAQPQRPSDFDQALVDAAVGSDNYRKCLGTIQWGAERVRSIAGETQRKILRLRDIDGFHQARRAAMVDFHQSSIRYRLRLIGLERLGIHSENYHQ